MSQEAERVENTGNASNDRFRDEDADVRLPKPQVVIIRDGESVYKPGMKTYLAGVSEEETEDGEGSDEGIKGSRGRTVGGVVCTCNSVCTCNTQSTCTCNTQTVCTCNPQTVCTCNPQSTCSCNNNYGCGYVCSCNPVH